MNLEPGICSKCRKHTAVKLSPGDELLCKDCYPVRSSHIENTCEDCKMKEGNVKLRQNDKLMCDLCWGRPMSTKYTLDRSTILVHSLSDMTVNEELTPSSEGKENTLEVEDFDDEDDTTAILDSSPLQSVSWILAEFYFNRGLQRLYTGTCIILQKTINGFLCLLIVFLKSKTYQLILKDVIKLNRNLW